MPDPYLNSILEALDDDDIDVDGPHLISVDELRAAGALDVPPAWRKSLNDERDLFSGLFDDEASSSEEKESTEDVSDDDTSLVA